MDLEEFPRWFPGGDVHAIGENGDYFLVGPALEAVTDAEAARQVAIGALDEFSAVITLLWPSLRRPTISHVFRETDDGKRNAFVLLTGSVVARCKAVGVAVSLSGGVPVPSSGPTEAQEMLASARNRKNLHIALLLWADPLRSWPRLYRILEEIEQELGRKVDVAGLCSGAERQRFTRTANSAEVAGADSRHAAGLFQPPQAPMTIPEATSFIGRLLQAALRM